MQTQDKWMTTWNQCGLTINSQNGFSLVFRTRLKFVDDFQTVVLGRLGHLQSMEMWVKQQYLACAKNRRIPSIRRDVWWLNSLHDISLPILTAESSCVSGDCPCKPSDRSITFPLMLIIEMGCDIPRLSPQQGFLCTVYVWHFKVWENEALARWTAGTAFPQGYFHNRKSVSPPHFCSS